MTHETVRDIAALLGPAAAVLGALPGLFAFFEARRAKDEARKANQEILANTRLTQRTSDKLHAVSGQIDGQQDKLLAAVVDAATMHGRAAVANELSQHIGAGETPVQRVEIVQPADSPVPTMVVQLPEDEPIAVTETPVKPKGK